MCHSSIGELWSPWNSWVQLKGFLDHGLWSLLTTAGLLTATQGLLFTAVSNICTHGSKRTWFSEVLALQTTKPGPLYGQTRSVLPSLGCAVLAFFLPRHEKGLGLWRPWNLNFPFSLRRPPRIQSPCENRRGFCWFGAPKPSKTTSFSSPPRAQARIRPRSQG